ncbi:MAG: hypothetical protein COB85_08745 [Bacteroidetes bacterium]|nr:MAG: hypothetical protein COB85_08745 [Bacteroidota bacterium]
MVRRIGLLLIAISFILKVEAQSLSLPYYTGFDSISQQAGWQEFRLGVVNSFNWKYEPGNPPPSSPNSLFHDYNVGGSPTDTTDDWFVSPPFIFNTSAQLSLKIFVVTTAGTTPSDYFGIWFSSGTSNPASGNFYELANLTDMQPQYQWLDTSIMLTTVTDSGYIAFRYGATDNWFQIYIDDVNIIPNNNSQTIDSVNIIPNNPTTLDTVKLIGYTFHPYSDCPMTSSSVNINNDTITVNVSHSLGIMPTTCISIDTLTIGILYAGTYELTYHLADTAPPTTYDIDTIIFTVQQSSGLQLSDNSEPRIKIYPNPTNEIVTIKTTSTRPQNITISIIDIQGKTIFSETLQSSVKLTKTLDLSTYIKGIYLIKVETPVEQITRKIVVE